MSEKKAHTPGPWEAQFETGFVYSVYALLVAEVYSGDGRGQQEANTRLIASAPELLEKCVKVVSWLDRLAKKADSDAESYARFGSLRDACMEDAKNYRRTADDIRSVIAKATGS